MKKLWICLILIFNIFLTAGCMQQETKEAETDMPAELMDKEWLFYDEVTSEHLVLRFGSDGSYSYHCQCGEPVGDSDLYELYTYNPETNIITLSNGYDDTTSEMELLGYNEHHVMLKIDDEVKDFNLVEMDTFSNFYSQEGEDYFSGYNALVRIIEFQEDTIVCAPMGYDPQGLYRDGPFEEYKLAEEVECAQIIITSWCSIQDDQEYEESYDKEYCELTWDEVKATEENGGGTAFLWFNEAMEVEKMLFWGGNKVVE